VRLEELRGVFEHSPWVAERAWAKQPFASLEALHDEMMTVVRRASREEQLALIRAHPELAGREATAGGLTQSSAGEQGRLGFLELSGEEFRRMAEINRRYREKFGFPCIIALRLHGTRATVMQAMERRIGNELESEVAAALEQIGHIAWGRLEKLLQ
jgi:OHCU decarboxylase